MKHEIIIKDESMVYDYKLEVDLYIDSYRNEKPNYKLSLYEKKRSERKWKLIVPYSYQKDNVDDILEYIGRKHITRVKMELWEMLKPEE